MDIVPSLNLRLIEERGIQECDSKPLTAVKREGSMEVPERLMAPELAFTGSTFNVQRSTFISRGIINIRRDHKLHRFDHAY
jgi:hypothetical protein